MRLKSGDPSGTLTNRMGSCKAKSVPLSASMLALARASRIPAADGELPDPESGRLRVAPVHALSRRSRGDAVWEKICPEAIFFLHSLGNTL